jgi:hypothetical protein
MPPPFVSGCGPGHPDIRKAPHGPGTIRAAIELKASRNISGADFSGLRSFRKEHPRVPLSVVCTAVEPYDADGVRVVPWMNFLKSLPDLLG